MDVKTLIQRVQDLAQAVRNRSWLSAWSIALEILNAAGAPEIALVAETNAGSAAAEKAMPKARPSGYDAMIDHSELNTDELAARMESIVANRAASSAAEVSAKPEEGLIAELDPILLTLLIRMRGM